jgi:3-oxoacyl-[acyl-carrier protein] reductase
VTGRFEGKRVVVTGAGSGFGRAIAEGFSSEGASVLAADVNRGAVEELCSGLPNAIAVEVDVLDEEANKRMCATAVDAWGGIDVLCANAGLPHRASNLIDLSTAEFERMFDINVRSIYFAAKFAVPHMPPGSSIIATSSVGSTRPRPGFTAYNASKGAVNTLVMGLATELAPNIRVNAVCPVSAPTGFDKNALGGEGMSAEFEELVVKSIPMGRRARPLDVANAVKFLASEEAEFLTGMTMNVDGGRSIL